MAYLWIWKFAGMATAGLIVALAGFALTKRRTDEPTHHRLIAGALASAIVALVLVGFASNSVARHLIQASPLLIAFALVSMRQPAGIAGAAALLGFWLVAMLSIWLYLLGVARIVTGRFGTAEIALTVAIGGSCVAGLLAAWRSSIGAHDRSRWLSALAFAALQVAAMVASVVLPR